MITTKLQCPHPNPRPKGEEDGQRQVRVKACRFHVPLIKRVLLVFLIPTSSFLLEAHAGSATWNSNPATGDWNTAGNWTPATVPNGPEDLASFGPSNLTNVSLIDR